MGSSTARPVFVITGTSGEGKSTLAKQVGGLVANTAVVLIAAPYIGERLRPIRDEMVGIQLRAPHLPRDADLASANVDPPSGQVFRR